MGAKRFALRSSKPSNPLAKDDVDNVGAGRAAKGASPATSTTKLRSLVKASGFCIDTRNLISKDKSCFEKQLFFILFLCNRFKDNRRAGRKIYFYIVLPIKFLGWIGDMMDKPVAPITSIIRTKRHFIILFFKNRHKHVCQRLIRTEIKGKNQTVAVKHNRLLRIF